MFRVWQDIISTMARSEDLRQNLLQHRPKNVDSKKSDKEIHLAVLACIVYLEKRLEDNLKGYRLTFSKQVSFGKLLSGNSWK